jgi:hypothetical protein
LRATSKALSGPPENLLLVEGDDDLNAVKHLLIAFGMSPRMDYYKVRVRITEGYPQYLDHLKDAARESGLQRLGLLLDADSDIGSRWASLRNVIHNIDGDFKDCLPKKPVSNGTVVNVPNRLRLGVWLMPDNGSPGAVEEFAHRLLPETDVLWPHVETSVANLPTKLFTDAHVMKAKLNTWLAWQKDPGKPIGIAIYERWLDPETPHCLTFKSWLENLFDLKPGV